LLVTCAILLGLGPSVSETTLKSSFDPGNQPDLQRTKFLTLFEYPVQQTEGVPVLATPPKSARKIASLTDLNNPFVDPPEKPILLAQAIYPAHRFSKLSPASVPPRILKRFSL
jgi:hypothetical protein